MHKTATFILLCFCFVFSSRAQTTNCELVAGFNATLTSPNTFHFQNTSIGLANTDSIRWTFGDGTSSNQLHPTHTYAHSGSYNVCIRIQKRNPNGVLTNCIRELCHVLIVEAPPVCELVASFSTSVTGINTFHFQNTSTGLSATDSIRWSFGDGTSSNQMSPTHTYALPGQYNVCIRIQKRNSIGGLSNCVRELCHLITVGTTINCELVAGFTATLTGTNTFQFTNTSVGLSPNDSIKWAFGDGTFSNQMSPTHTYALPGQYNVCIRIQKRNPNGILTNCVRELCHVVVVTSAPPCELTAGFTSTSTGQNTYHFQNTSVGLSATDSIRWTFGDGTSSNQVNPNHTYAQPGNYNVCIRIQKRNSLGVLSTCVRELCHTITVSGQTSCTLVAGFTGTLVGLNTFHFQNTSTGLSSTDSIRWTFGDGTSSNQVSPDHTYAQPGQYNVCIRIQTRNTLGQLSTCVRELCHTVTIGNPNGCELFANFTATPTGANIYHFQNTSVNLSPGDSIRWTFGDGTTSNQVNPSHTYAQPGQYNVCIRIIKRNSAGTITNCIREFCKLVNVGASNICDLLATFNVSLLAPNSYHFQNTSTGLSPNDSIRWTFGDGGSSNQLHPNHTYAQAGHYNVCLRIQKRNTGSTLSNCVREVCHMVEPTSTTTCALPYPNPASNIINVQVPLVQSQMIHVTIYNASNLLVKEKHQQGVSGSNVVSILIADLTPGVYTMKVRHENNICISSFVKM